MLMGFFITTPYLRIHRKWKELKEIDPKIRRNLVTVAWAKSFTYIIAGSIGFERVAVVTIGLVRKGAVDYLRFRIFGVFSRMFSSDDTDSPIQMYWTQTHRHIRRQKCEIFFIVLREER